MYSFDSGSTATMKSGVTMPITSSVDRQLRIVRRYICSTPGSDMSIDITSFEKRFRMRPTGVVSKNAIGARITQSSIALCSVRAE
jgi:hypothetical protein